MSDSVHISVALALGASFNVVLSALHKFKPSMLGLEGVFACGNRIFADRRHGVQIDKPEK